MSLNCLVPFHLVFRFLPRCRGRSRARICLPQSPRFYYGGERIERCLTRQGRRNVEARSVETVDAVRTLNCIKQRRPTSQQANKPTRLQTSRQATTKVAKAVLSSLAGIGLSGSHVRAEHLRGLSVTTTTIDRDREGTPSHSKLLTMAPHRPTSNSLYLDTFTTSNDGWSSATHTNFRHSLDVAIGPFRKGSSPSIKTDDVTSLKDQEDRRVQFDLVKSDS